MKQLVMFIKESGKLKDIILQSVFWMIVSVVAAYPSFCLKGDPSMFHTVTRDDYCDKFLIPIVLFLAAFIGDFWFSIKDLPIGQKRGYLLKSLILLIFVMFTLLFLITVIPQDMTEGKIGGFILLWISLSLIKGLTVLIPGSDEEVTLTKPLTNI